MQIDPRWTIFSGVNNNFDDFVKTMVPEMYLRPEVHNDVKENFEVIRRLLEHSFYSYEFYDVAVTQSVLTLEMAVKIRFREVTHEPKLKSLFLYLKWFQDRSFFEVIFPPFLDHIRTIRNHLAHPSGRTIAGPTARPVLENIIDLVNALYEDPMLRIERMNQMTQLRKRLEDFSGEMIISGSAVRQEQLCFDAWVAFIDNKGPLPEIHIYYRPYFELSERVLQRLGHIEAPVVYFKANSWQASVEGISFSNVNGQMLIISPVKSDHDRELTAQWKIDTDGLLLLRPDCIIVNNRRMDPFQFHLRAFNRK